MCLSDPFLKLYKLLFLFSFFLKKIWFLSSGKRFEERYEAERTWSEVILGDLLWQFFLLCFSFLGFRESKMQFFVFGWGFGLGIWCFFFVFVLFPVKLENLLLLVEVFVVILLGFLLGFFLLLLVWVILSTNCVSLICS